MRKPVTMNPDVKKLWLEALRSGEYEQGVGTLHTTNGRFCCLGVLCDVAVKQKVLAAPTDVLTQTIYHGGYPGGSAEVETYLYPSTSAGEGDMKQSSFLPRVVSEWSAVPVYGDRSDTDGGVLEGLAGLNDEGRTFLEIADIIEAEY